MNNKTTHYYILPDDTTAKNMREARKRMGIGVQGFRALVRKGIVKKIITTETSEYDSNKTTIAIR